MDHISGNLVLPGSTPKPSPVSTSTATDSNNANIGLQTSTTENPSVTEGTSFRCTCRPCCPHRNGRNDQFRSDPHRHLAFPKYYTWDGHLRLEARKYDCKDITTSLIGMFEKTPRRNKSSTHLQSRALVSWQSWVESQRQQPSPLLTLENRMDLGFFLDIFDNYFFGGALSKWTTVTWVDPDQMRRSWRGSQADNPLLPGSYSLVKIINRRSVVPGGPSAIMQTLNTLLHEMVHSMLNTFACRCQCAFNTSGVSGHGRMWVDLARALERELNSKFGGYGVWDLRIENASKRESAQCRKIGLVWGEPI